MNRFATLAVFAALASTPALAGSNKHRGYDGGYNRGSIVSACNHHANARGLRGHDRRDFVEWCTDRGRHYASLDRDRYRRDRNHYHYRDRDYDRYYDRYYGRDYVHYRDDWRYHNDWRYVVLREVILAELRRDWDD